MTHSGRITAIKTVDIEVENGPDVIIEWQGPGRYGCQLMHEDADPLAGGGDWEYVLYEACGSSEQARRNGFGSVRWYNALEELTKRLRREDNDTA